MDQLKAALTLDILLFIMYWECINGPAFNSPLTFNHPTLLGLNSVCHRSRCILCQPFKEGICIYAVYKKKLEWSWKGGPWDLRCGLATIEYPLFCEVTNCFISDVGITAQVSVLYFVAVRKLEFDTTPATLKRRTNRTARTRPGKIRVSAF